MFGKQRSKIGYDKLDKKRYEHEIWEYRNFLHNFSLKNNIEDSEYVEFVIDLLRKEIKYSSLLEIYRGNSYERFIYPFHKMNDELIGYRIEGKRQIDLLDNNLISSPWSENRYKKMIKHLSKNSFKFDESNHIAYYYDYLNIACAVNGFHSLGIGAYYGRGTIDAYYYDTTKIFDYVCVNADLSFSYNKEKIYQRLTIQDVFLAKDIKDILQERFYGTDYRLILLYKLCQYKYFNDKGKA